MSRGHGRRRWPCACQALAMPALKQRALTCGTSYGMAVVFLKRLVAAHHEPWKGTAMIKLEFIEDKDSPSPSSQEFAEHISVCQYSPGANPLR